MEFLDNLTQYYDEFASDLFTNDLEFNQILQGFSFEEPRNDLGNRCRFSVDSPTSSTRSYASEEEPYQSCFDDSQVPFAHEVVIADYSPDTDLLANYVPGQDLIDEPLSEEQVMAELAKISPEDLDTLANLIDTQIPMTVHIKQEPMEMSYKPQSLQRGGKRLRQFKCIACEKDFLTRPCLKKHFKSKGHERFVHERRMRDPAYDESTWHIGPRLR